MRIVVVIVVLLALSGCGVVPAAVDAGARAADATLEELEDAICSRHFSLRAYYDRYADRWAVLAEFCRWGGVPPPPPPSSELFG